MENLSKKMWISLNRLGLVNGIGNGFANTTEKFDNNIICNKSHDTIISINGIYLMVKYYDGCFYPKWYYNTINKAPNYFINRKGDIILNK